MLKTKGFIQYCNRHISGRHLWVTLYLNKENYKFKNVLSYTVNAPL